MSLHVHSPPNVSSTMCMFLWVYDTSCALFLHMRVPSRSVFPPYVCPLHVHVSSMRMSPSVCVPSICMSPPCSCLFHGYVPPVCMSPPCAVASVCMFLCVVVPSYVCYPCVYVPGCACCFRVYVGPPCVDPLCVFVPPRGCSIV